MKKALALFCLLIAVGLAAQQRSDILVLDHATIIDGTGRPAIRNGAIVIEGDRIRDIGPRGSIQAGKGVTVVDVGGKWVVPGYIDAHIHFDQSGDIFTRPDAVDLRQVRPYEDEIAWTRQRIPVTLLRYLASGITSVVDMGGPMWTFDVRDMANASSRAPRTFVSGPLISPYDEPVLDTAKDVPVVVAHSAAEARALVRRNLERKPDLIKILFIRNGEDLERTTPIVAAAIEESHAHGVRVAVHATELDTAKAALRAGADVLVHGVSDRRIDREFIDLMTKRNIPYITTLIVSEGYDEVFAQAVNLTDIEKRLGDAQVIDTWSQLAKTPEEDIPGGIPSEKLRANQNIEFNNLRLMDAAGGRIVAGTDAGNIGTLHGPALHREFELMAEAGMRPADILVAATRNAAFVVGREADLGTLERGKLADLLILGGDPNVDVKNARKINRIMKNGVFVQVAPEDLK